MTMSRWSTSLHLSQLVVPLRLLSNYCILSTICSTRVTITSDAFAFDVVNHKILLKELSTLGMNSSIFNWIADFLTGRSQAVKLGDISAFLMITRSIVQGSGLGPYLFILLARKLRALSLINRLVKYADEMTLVVPQHTDCLIGEELKNIVYWAENNKQNINTNKTKEIFFGKLASHLKLSIYRLFLKLNGFNRLVC